MSQTSRRRIAIVALIIALLVLLLVNCQRPKPVATTPASQPVAAQPAQSAAPVPGTAQPDEVTTPATLQFPAQVPAGKPFAVKWTGPDNAKDYITVVRRTAAASVYGNYRDAREGNPVDLLAPIEAGEWEVRYVTARTKTVLGRAPLRVVSNEVTLTAPLEVVAGSSVTVNWTGPNNPGDYLTLVPASLPDGQYGNYINTTKGPTFAITAPIATGDAELRYMTGQGAKVLHRIPVRVVAAKIGLDAPATASSSAKVTITWTGPNNAGDYLTIVPQSLPDGRYAGYTTTDRGSPLAVVAPKEAGLAEIRYISGQGAKVLARRPILITP
jgi:hypothetical protein